MEIIEKGLIPIYEDNSKQVADARELHEFLESKQEFTNWIKSRIEKYGFVENEDFMIILSKSTGGRPSTEYALTINTAKEIAMVENNEKGRIIRKYFIEVENRVKQPKQMTQMEIVAASANQLVLIERKTNIALETANRTSRQVENALNVLAKPPEPDWQIATNDKIRGMALNYGLSYPVLFGDLYKELEDTVHVNLGTRVVRLQGRMKQEGAKYKERMAITKLHVISTEPVLKLAFDGIVRRYDAKYAVERFEA